MRRDASNKLIMQNLRNSQKPKLPAVVRFTVAGITPVWSDYWDLGAFSNEIQVASAAPLGDVALYGS
jgi:hypothetical protein